MVNVNFPHRVNEHSFAHLQKTVIDGELIVLHKIKDIQVFSTPFSPQYGILTFCKQGWAEGVYNNTEIRVSAGDVCIIPKFSIVTFKKASEDFEALTILFTSDSQIGEMMKLRRPVKYLIEIYHRPVLTPAPNVWPIVMKSISLIEDISANTTIPNRLELLMHIFTMLFKMVYKSKLFNAEENIVKSRAEHLFEVFADEVMQHIADSHKVSYYADSLCITSNYLSKVCRQVANVSARDFINTCIIVQSQFLLVENKKMSIQEIAIKTGFPSQSFFAKFFRLHVGMSPSAYRQQRFY